MMKRRKTYERPVEKSEEVGTSRYWNAPRKKESQPEPDLVAAEKSTKRRLPKAALKRLEQRKTGGNISNRPQGGALALTRGLAAAYMLTCVVFIVFALILTYTGVSESTIPVVSFVCTAVSAILAGLLTARATAKNGLFWGLLAGALYSLVLFGVGLLIGDGFALNLGRFGTFLLAVAGGGIGGILGVNR